MAAAERPVARPGERGRPTLTAVDERPIGMFDSGFGGLTVARALIDLLPAEDLVYVGDTGRYPYGSAAAGRGARPSPAQITRYLVDDHDVKMVVVACNTAAAAALDELQAEFPVPVVGVIEPGVRALVSATRNGQVGRDRHGRAPSARVPTRRRWPTPTPG